LPIQNSIFASKIISIPETDDTFMNKEEMYAKLDKGIEEYRQGKTKTLKWALR
jgi:hypothetical protein